MTAVVLKANAKLTVSLRITGVRDDGYHLLDAEMVTLDLADTVTFAEGSGVTALTMSGPFAAGIATDDSNLVVRALRLAERTAAVHVDKVIPSGGGLGGGSADAAAVLRWAGVRDLALAARLGADVPICMIGGRARVEGIGEILTPLPFEERIYTLVTPPLAVSTIAAYRMWDELGGPRAQGPNDLEPAALAVEPRLAEWRDRIAEAVGSPPVLAGSGSTYFVDGDHLDVLGGACGGANVVLARTALVDPI
ncbi:MAG: 4-(cytidine 5'-diphospho)-2-C-methyl-D-erythritol kinase [Acidimicrobiia bacterium]